MGETKYRLETYSFYDYAGIAARLEEQAQKGWMLQGTHFGLWKYKRIQPENMRFAVCSYPAYSTFEPEHSSRQERFLDFCEYAGWKFVCDMGQMQIFYDQTEAPVPLDTEPELELGRIRELAVRKYLPLYLLWIGLCVWNLCLHGTLQKISGIWLALLLMCVVEVTGYLSWYGAAKRNAQRGEALPVAADTSGLKCLLLAVGLGSLLIDTAWMGTFYLQALFLCMAGILGVMGVLSLARSVLRKKNVPARVNRMVMWGISFLVLAMLIIIFFKEIILV